MPVFYLREFGSGNYDIATLDYPNHNFYDSDLCDARL